MSVMVRVDMEPAYVLHARAYRETSQIIEVFTPTHGRAGLVARGARRPKSVFRGLLDPFQALRVSWSGRGELSTLRDAELAGQASPINAERIISAFYVNELLLKLLQRNDPHPDLFALYTQTITALADVDALEPLLRAFELGLLHEIGYAPNLVTDAVMHEALLPEQMYEFHVEQGALPAADRSEYPYCFTGELLLAIGRRDFSAPEKLLGARRFLRFVINHYVGEPGLRTRKVAAAMKR